MREARLRNGWQPAFPPTTVANPGWVTAYPKVVNGARGLERQLMADATFLCSLDVTDPLVLRRGTSLVMRGWVIETSGATIDEISVVVNGDIRIAADYPEHRPDVGDYYPQFHQARSSGFVTHPIPLEFGAPPTLEFHVFVNCGGASHHTLTRRVRALWLDGAEDIFPFGLAGPFRYPADVDENRLATFPTWRPVVLVGEEQDVRTAVARLASTGHQVLDGALFHALLKAVVECHDVHSEVLHDYFGHLREQLHQYGLGRLDIYDVMNDLLACFSERILPAQSGESFVCALAGPLQATLLPFIHRLYPNASFIHLLPDQFGRIEAGGAGPAPANGEQSTDDRILRYETACLDRSVRDIVRLSGRRCGFQEIPAPHDFPDGLLRLRPSRIIAGRMPEATSSRVAAYHTGPSPHLRSSSVQPASYLQVIAEIPDSRPVFVLGAGRSGTSAVVGAIDAAGIKGDAEGHLFPLLNKMLSRVWTMISPPSLKDELPADLKASFIQAIAMRFARTSRGNVTDAVWRIKTPDHAMIACVPLAYAMFPRASFIMVYRHPISFAESRRRKFREPIESSISEWIKCIRIWADCRDRLPPSRYVEADVADFRGSCFQERMCKLLDFDEAQAKRVRDYFSSQRPELTRVSLGLLTGIQELPEARQYRLRSIYFEMLDSVGEYLEDMDWEGEVKNRVLTMLGSLPEEFGFAVRRPPDAMHRLVAKWAGQLEEYRHAAEFHAANAAHWADEAKRWREIAKENAGGEEGAKTS